MSSAPSPSGVHLPVCWDVANDVSDLVDDDYLPDLIDPPGSPRDNSSIPGLPEPRNRMGSLIRGAIERRFFLIDFGSLVVSAGDDRRIYYAEVPPSDFDMPQ